MEQSIQDGVNPAIRPPLENHAFHVIVVGGGINGVAIARECAHRGHRALLLEQNDFGSGTTSRSTRIIHGGLRYLEHGDLAQVRESLRERASLLHQYPNLVRPMRFLLARDDNSSRSALTIRIGLWLYRKFGGTALRTDDGDDQKRRLERLLDSGRQFSVFNFEDAQCEFPERLVAEWLTDATDAGCVARNHTEVLSVEIQDRRATGVRVRDRLSGKENLVHGLWIVNAGGPWADNLCRMSGVQTAHPLIGGVRGSHIVLPRFPDAPSAAIYTEAVDGRPIFVVPWNEQLLVGTTEVPDSANPDAAHPASDEIQYLLASLRKLFPKLVFDLSHIRYAFAGVRPLPFAPKANPSAVTRRHFFHDHSDDGAQNMVSVVGGKLTTAASMAREFVEQVIGDAPVNAASPPVIEETNFDAKLNAWAATIAREAGISRDAASKVVEWFGPRAAAIARASRQAPELRTPLYSESRHVLGEAVYAFQREHAATLADVLLRRVPVAFAPDWSDESALEAATRIGTALHWSESETRRQFETFLIEKNSFLKNPKA